MTTPTTAPRRVGYTPAITGPTKDQSPLPYNLGIALPKLPPGPWRFSTAEIQSAGIATVYCCQKDDRDRGWKVIEPCYVYGWPANTPEAHEQVARAMMMVPDMLDALAAILAEVGPEGHDTLPGSGPRIAARVRDLFARVIVPENEEAV